MWRTCGSRVRQCCSIVRDIGADGAWRCRWCRCRCRCRYYFWRRRRNMTATLGPSPCVIVVRCPTASRCRSWTLCNGKKCIRQRALLCHILQALSELVLAHFCQAERMELMCTCQRQEQQVADLRKLVDEIAKLEQGAPDVSGAGSEANWETQSICSDVSGVSPTARYSIIVMILCSCSGEGICLESCQGCYCPVCSTTRPCDVPERYSQSRDGL